MNDIDAWILFEGPEPELVRPLLDALRELPPKTPEEKEHWTRRFFEKLDAHLAQKEQPPAATPPTPPTPPLTATLLPTVRAAEVRSVGEYGAAAEPPKLDEPIAAAPPAEPSLPSRPAAARGLRPALGSELQGLTTTLIVPTLTTAGPEPVTFRRLSPIGYAALQAELAMWPERRDETLRRFNVIDDAAHKALEEHCQAELAASSEAREEFEKTFAYHTATLRSRRP